MQRINTKVLILTLFVLLTCSICSIPVSAAYAFKLTGTDITNFEEVLEYVDTVVANGGDETGSLKIGALADVTGTVYGTDVAETQLFVQNDAGGGMYVFNQIAYKNLSRRIQKSAMQTFYEGIDAHDFSVEAKQKISNALSEVSDSYTDSIVNKILKGTKADTVSAVKYVEEWIPKIRVGFGVVVIIAAFFFVYLLVADMLYLNVVLFQNMFPPDKEGFSPFTKGARTAVAESLARGDYVNPMIIYWKKQWIVYLLYLIILSLAITGGFSDVFVKIVGAF